MTKVSYFFRQYKAITAATVAFMFLQAFGTLYIPTIMSDIVNRGILRSDLPYIYAAGEKMVVTALFTAIAAIGGAFLASTLASRWGQDIRNLLFQKAQDFSVRDFNRFGTASMITRCTNDAAQLQDALVRILAWC